MKSKIFAVIIFITLLNPAIAQQTGAFQKYIQFNGQSRLLSYYIPPNYQSDTTYRLVVGLHGCGGNAVGFRNQLKFLADSIHALVVCPVGLVGNSGYMGPPDMGIIGAAIDSTRALYSVDTSEVFLLGFSCNAYATLLDGMFSVNFKYKGIISWHAALDSTDFLQGVFDYTPATKICLCTGTADSYYHDLNVQLKDSLAAHTSNFLFTDVPGLGHTTSFPAFKEETMKCFRFMTTVVTPPPSTVTTAGFSENNTTTPGGQVFPNPAGSKVYVKLNSKTDCKLQVLNTLGDVLLERVLQSGLNEIPFEGMPAGLYLFKMSDSTGSATVRIIKE